MKTENATIEDVRLEIEDHGILSLTIMLDFSGFHQGFGGYALDDYDKTLKKRVGTDWGMEFVRRILETLETNELSKLVGRNCRVKKKEGWNAKIESIGHITKDKWFEPEVDLKFLLEKSS